MQTGGKGAPVHCWWERESVQPHGRQYGDSSEIKNRTSLSSSSPVSGYPVKGTRSGSQRETAPAMSAASQSQWPNFDHNQVPISTRADKEVVCTPRGCYSAMTKKEILPFPTAWVNLEGITLSEEPDREGQILYGLVHLRNPNQKAELLEAESRRVGRGKKGMSVQRCKVAVT